METYEYNSQYHLAVSFSLPYSYSATLRGQLRVVGISRLPHVRKFCTRFDISWCDSLEYLCWRSRRLCWMQSFMLNRMVLFSKGVIGEKTHEPQQKQLFFGKLRKFFLARFAWASVLALRRVVLDSELNSASNEVKIMGDHRTTKFSLTHNLGFLWTAHTHLGETFCCPMIPYDFDFIRCRIQFWVQHNPS